MRLITAIVVSFFLLDATPLYAAASSVFVTGRQLVVRKRLSDGSLGAPAPYAIRGVVWSPASDSTNTSPSDPNNVAVRRLEFSKWVATDAPLLAAMHVNTVRLVIDPGTDASGTAVLDQLYANGIMVIMTVDEGADNLTRVSQVVNFYKDHPAILMWMLGNEWNICSCDPQQFSNPCGCSHPYYSGAAVSVVDAAQRTQAAAALIKSIDSAHPVATSYGDIDINTSGEHLSDTQNYVNNVCTSVDVWSLNIYRGNSFGNLFTQWASITAKPMFLGEFGTDAFRSAGSTSAGSVDGTMQSDWNVPLWDEIFVNLSKNVPEAVALGGTVFEFNDEWWKVSPAGSQESGGFSGPQPDGFANEEYFGLFDITRHPREAVAALTAAFDVSYQPLRTHSYRVISRGYLAQEYSFEFGTAWIFKDGVKLYSAIGGGGGGRGFNVAVIDPSTDALWQPVQHFDTYSASHSGTGDFCTMNTFLDTVPNGMLVLIGVADEAGLDNFPPNSCQVLGTSCLSGTLQRLASLKSQQIGSYCYGSSWAFAAVKGEALARGEGVGSAIETQARTTLPMITHTLTTSSTGSGSIDAVPAGVSCGANCTTFPVNTNAMLYAVPGNGWVFSSWSGGCSGPATPCSVSMDADRSVAATFILAATKLVITSITPASPTAGSAFSVTVQAQDANGNAANVVASTAVQLSRTSGTGSLGGTTSGSITAGTSSVTITGVTYTRAESGVVVTATRTSGDVLAAGDSPAFSVLAGAATKLLITSITPSTPTAGSAFSVTVQAQDANGNAANVVASTAVQLSRTSGTGSLGGTTSGSITAGTNSVTIAGVTYTRAESGVVVTATRTSGDVLASGDSPAFSVLAGAATKLVITSITPASPTAGSAFSVTVQAQDANGNAANVVASTAVQLSRTSGTGSLGGTTSGSITAGTNSVTIAGVTYTRAESGVVVTATRTSGDVLASGDSAAFSVLAGAATRLVITSITPSSPTAGSAFSVTVQAQDANGNAANVVASTAVQLSRTSGTGSLGGTTSGSITAGTNSVTIAGVTYTRAESGVVVTAARTSGDVLASGDSPAFSVLAGAATKLVITSITPSSPTAGSAFSVTVQAQDANGNAANVIASTAVQLSRTSGTGSLGGTTSGSITAGTNSVTIAGVTYTTAESGVVVTATRTSGDVLASGGSPAFSVLPHPTSLYTVAPCRVLDTRDTSPLPNLATRDVQINGVCGIPNSAVAVAANITAVTPEGIGFLAFYPTGSTWPGNSTINYNTAKTRANNAILTLSAGGSTTVLNNGSTQHFIIDVMGYFQ